MRRKKEVNSILHIYDTFVAADVMSEVEAQMGITRMRMFADNNLYNQLLILRDVPDVIIVDLWRKSHTHLEIFEFLGSFPQLHKIPKMLLTSDIRVMGCPILESYDISGIIVRPIHSDILQEYIEAIANNETIWAA